MIKLTLNFTGAGDVKSNWLWIGRINETREIHSTMIFQVKRMKANQGLKNTLYYGSLPILGWIAVPFNV